jgi:hypothetical protein
MENNDAKNIVFGGGDNVFCELRGKSYVTAEVVPLDKVCAYEKWKTVAVEGYLAPNTIVCERSSQEKRSGVVWCTFNR